MIPYDKTHDPPAPMLSITVSGVVRSRPRVTVPALIDTGSDITAVPAELAEKLRLYEFGRLQIEGVHGVTSPVYTYEARLAHAERTAREIEVILTHLPFVILGRDWLQNYYLCLNGPDQRLQLSDKPLPIQN